MLFPQVMLEMLHAEYWIKHSDNPDTVIRDAVQIAGFNQAVRRNLPAACPELTTFPDRIKRRVLESWLTVAAVPAGSLYQDGQLLSASDYETLRTNLNLKALATLNLIQYGFTVTRTNLRTFPTADPIVTEPDRPEFESFQETGLNPAEPVLILHQSPTADWSFIQTGNYRGWAPTVALAIAASRRQWLDYLRMETFFVVTGNNFTLPAQGATPPLYFEMGAKLPLVTATPQADGIYTALFPVTDRQHRLRFTPVSLPATTDLHLGYLNYTRANLFRQAFKFYDQPYDWGGLHGGVDCSGLILDVYRCFGFNLPRNVAEQERLPGKRVDLRSLSLTDKKAALRNLPPGATLYLQGHHVMFYLGTVNDTPYILHALSSYGIPDESGQIHKTYHLQVAVTDLSLQRANGQIFLEALTTAVEVK
jgi:hypothetical protein